MNFDAIVREATKGLVERLPCFKRITPRLIAFTPVEHFGYFVLLRTYARREYFLVEWRINMFCEPDSSFGLTIGRTWGLVGRSLRFKPKGQGGLFEVNDPTMVKDFIDQIEAEILPLFRSLDSFQKAAEFEMSHPDLHVTKTVRWKALVTAAMGDIPAAQKLWRSCDTDQMKWRVPGMTKEWGSYDEWCRISEPLMDGDRSKLTKLLHEWEEREVKGSKLERYWKSTPFPLEEVS